MMTTIQAPPIEDIIAPVESGEQRARVGFYAVLSVLGIALGTAGLMLSVPVDCFAAAIPAMVCVAFSALLICWVLGNEQARQ